MAAWVGWEERFLWQCQGRSAGAFIPATALTAGTAPAPPSCPGTSLASRRWLLAQPALGKPRDLQAGSDTGTWSRCPAAGDSGKRADGLIPVLPGSSSRFSALRGLGTGSRWAQHRPGLWSHWARGGGQGAMPGALGTCQAQGTVLLIAESVTVSLRAWHRPFGSFNPTPALSSPLVMLRRDRGCLSFREGLGVTGLRVPFVQGDCDPAGAAPAVGGGTGLWSLCPPGAGGAPSAQVPSPQTIPSPPGTPQGWPGPPGQEVGDGGLGTRRAQHRSQPRAERQDGAGGWMWPPLVSDRAPLGAGEGVPAVGADRPGVPLAPGGGC